MHHCSYPYWIPWRVANVFEEDPFFVNRRFQLKLQPTNTVVGHAKIPKNQYVWSLLLQEAKHPRH
jgi:hypothetical protein